MQFTIVRNVPLDSPGTLCATSVENIGESAATTNPQKIRKAIKSQTELLNKIKGENMQHAHDRDRATAAIFFAPKRCENRPPKAQASPPQPIIRKDKKDTLRFAPG